MQFTRLVLANMTYLSDSSGEILASHVARSGVTWASTGRSGWALMYCAMARALVRVQVFAEANSGDVARHLLVLLIFGDQRPGQAGFLHGLEANEQLVQREVHFLERDAHVLQCQHRANHVGPRCAQLAPLRCTVKRSDNF